VKYAISKDAARSLTQTIGLLLLGIILSTAGNVLGALPSS
jgi:hypothetical protein